ncbi:aquaporin [Candidatus Saccharibacteria bacterium]|nr:aquaporin [Candidatus Saccharibacteria bacterium]
MATKAKSTSRARSTKTTRPAAAKAASTKKTVSRTAPIAVAKVEKPNLNLSNDLNGVEVIGEMLGTFLLVSIVTATGGNAFLVGIALIVIVAMLFNVSGAHVNPAVSFGFWAMRRISAVKMFFYWMAQFVGAIAAILAVSAFSGDKVNISLASFTQWDWYVVAAELLGASVFMFGIAAAVTRGKNDSERGLGIGLALFLALLVSGGLLQQAVTTATAKQQQTTEAKEMPRITKLSGTTLNPAVALSQSEADTSNALGGQTKSTTASRLTLETIVGTLIGAGIGGRLYMLLSRNRS